MAWFYFVAMSTRAKIWSHCNPSSSQEVGNQGRKPSQTFEQRSDQAKLVILNAPRANTYINLLEVLKRTILAVVINKIESLYALMLFYEGDLNFSFDTVFSWL